MARVSALRGLLLLALVACSSTPHRDEVDPRPPPADMPEEALAACDDLEGLDGSFCRVQARVHFARQRRDTVLVACLNGPYQRLVAIREGGDQDGGRVGDVMTEREVLRLEREAEACMPPVNPR